MSFNLEALKTETSQLSRSERAILAKPLISTLENDDDNIINVKELWLQEAKKRYQLYLEGKIQSKAASIVFQEAFASLK
jgi:hypothetical protein